MKYKVVIITGASSGLGEEFAKQLAPDAEHLVLVARRVERLEELGQQLKTEFPQLNVSHEQVDLADPDQRESFGKKLTDGTYPPHVLINNAGMGDLGCVEKANWPKVDTMLQVNITALTHLAHLVIPEMKKHGGGHIVNVSSMASIMPIPDFSVYAASKAYVTSFSEALRLELKEDKINVLALCPGPVGTEFSGVAGRYEEGVGSEMQKWAYVSKERCIREALNAMDVNKATVFPGLQIKVLTTVFKALPMPLLRMVMGRRPRRVD